MFGSRGWIVGWQRYLGSRSCTHLKTDNEGGRGGGGVSAKQGRCGEIFGGRWK